MNVEAGLQLSDLQGIVRRRAKLMLGVALLVSLAAYWLAMALPNEYESYATVLVEPQSVDPDLVEAGVPERSPPGGADSSMNSEAQMPSTSSAIPDP